MSDDEANVQDLDALKRRFAISPLIDLEIDVGGEGLIGLSAEVSHQLRLNVTASAIADRLGFSSVDYVRRRYLNGSVEHEPRDAPLRRLIAEHESAYDQFYRSFVPARSDAPLGVFAFDLTFVRATGSIKLLSSIARQGFLIEPCAIARCLIEQLAYAVHVWDKEADEDVFGVKPQALIRSLAPISKNAGRAYGILSQLCHYDPKKHYNFLGDDFGETVNQRSWKFKMVSVAWVFYIINLQYLVFMSSYGDF